MYLPGEQQVKLMFRDHHKYLDELTNIQHGLTLEELSLSWPLEFHSSVSPCTLA